jgi:hypothetical protein
VVDTPEDAQDAGEDEATVDLPVADAHSGVVFSLVAVGAALKVGVVLLEAALERLLLANEAVFSGIRK